MPPETSMSCEKGILLVVDDVGIRVYLVDNCEWSWVSGRSFIIICSVPVSKSLVEHKKKQKKKIPGSVSSPVVVAFHLVAPFLVRLWWLFMVVVCRIVALAVAVICRGGDN